MDGWGGGGGAAPNHLSTFDSRHSTFFFDVNFTLLIWKNCFRSGEIDIVGRYYNKEKIGSNGALSQQLLDTASAFRLLLPTGFIGGEKNEVKRRFVAGYFTVGASLQW